MLKISSNEKVELRNNAKRELERLERILSNKDDLEMLDRFKNTFNICETVYKVILAEHQKRKGNLTNEHLKLTMTQVPYALEFAGYNFDKRLLNELFGSKSHNGTTVKKLRDKITHGLNEKAIIEISNRKEELFGYMDAFLLEIRMFDERVA